MIATSRMLMVLMLVCLAAACDQRHASGDVVLPRIADGEGRVEWRGMLSCADCDGIETLLVLERQGDAHRYDLVETFLAEPDGARFVESGQWQLDNGSLQLQGERGATRHYALLPDGRLQARDGRGRPFRRRGDFLVPADDYAP